MNRRQLFSLCGLGPLLGCGRSDPAGTIQVSAGPYLYLCPLYLAVELGYFSDAGLTIELQQMAHSSQAIPLLAGGQVDVAFAAVSPAVLNAVGRGADVRIVAAQDHTTPSCPGISQLLVRRSAYPRGLPDLEQMRGKRIAILAKAGWAEFSLEQMLAGAGMSASEVEVVILRPPEALAALLAGKVDAVVTPDHFGKNPATVSPDLVPISGLTEVLPGLAYTYVMFGRRMLRGDLDTGARFLSALSLGIREYLKGRTPRFLEEFARSNGMDPSDARQLCRETASPDGDFPLESLQIFIDWARRKGYCTEPVKAEDIFDRRFLTALGGRAG